MSQEAKTEKTSSGSIKLMLIPAALLLYVIAIYVIQPLVVEGSAWIILDATSVLLALGGALVFAVVSHRFGWLSTKSGQISVLITFGLILWAFAELFWFQLESVGMEPFPSIADFFYISGYIPFAVALLVNIRTIHVKFKLPTLVLWIVLSLIATVVIVLVAILPILQGGGSPEDVIGVVYPIEDLVIIVLALVILLKFRAGEIAKAWGLLVLGFIVESVGDIVFWYEAYAGLYQTTGPYDIADFLLYLGYIAILASGLLFISTFGARRGRDSA